MPTAAERYNFAEVEPDGRKLIQETLKWCNVDKVLDLKQENVMKAGNKDVLAAQLVRALGLIERQHNFIMNQRVHLTSYREDIIKLQEQVITQQDQIIRTQTFRENFKTDIVNTVQQEVKSVRKSFSDVVRSGTVNNASAKISHDTLKTVAKQIVIEEELSKNIMVFGLQAKDSKELDVKISEVF